jgi:H/ACA ribonucleoprotein complex subunit 3
MTVAGRLAVCPKCRRYSLRAACPACGHATTTPHPARFSPEDPYGKYRRRLKRLTQKTGSA